jgi:hypothetical protein
MRNGKTQEPQRTHSKPSTQQKRQSSKSLPISQIMQYQGIDKEDFAKAVEVLNNP